MYDLIISAVILTVCYFAGRAAEAKHYHSIKKREKALSSIPVLTMNKNTLENDEIESAQMVYGSVVIAMDYFKEFLGNLINFIGGEVSTYETLLDRGRREATLRMKEMALGLGGDVITNFRIETATIIKNNQKSGCVEVLAYGTAITVKKGKN